jgi:hypothetical protein
MNKTTSFIFHLIKLNRMKWVVFSFYLFIFFQSWLETLPGFNETYAVHWLEKQSACATQKARFPLNTI